MGRFLLPYSTEEKNSTSIVNYPQESIELTPSIVGLITY